MQLRMARLCLDCEEVHDALRCPVCASDMFTPITRWVPAPERRNRTRLSTPESASRVDAYRALIDGEPRPSAVRRLLKGGAIGVAAVGILGWFMRTPPQRRN